MTASRHLAPEQVFGYEHQLLTPDEVRAVHAHIAGCEECRGELAGRIDIGPMARDLQAELRVAPANRVPRFLAYAAAAAAIAAIVFGIAVQRGDREVEAALRAGRIAVPAFVEELNPPREVLMGARNSAENELLAPRGTAVLPGRPVFQWRALSPGWTYQVHVFDANGAALAESPNLEVAKWEMDRPLPSGLTLQWQVTATRGEERQTLGRPPESPAKFRIVDAPTADRLQSLARSNPGRLRLAIAYGGAGLLENARQELREDIAGHPGDVARQRLLENLSGFGR
jgi:hypothetical protein